MLRLAHLGTSLGESSRRSSITGGSSPVPPLSGQRGTLLLSVIADNLGNLLRRLALPSRIGGRS